MQKWLDLFLASLKKTFPDRIFFVGLQGSRARGEEHEKSDIDVVVILNEVSFEDIGIYRAMLQTLPHQDLICGFFSGKEELLSWEPSDLFQFYYDTNPILGSLDEILPLLDRQAVKRAVKIGACNLYHGCVHNLLFDQSPEGLKELYKAASFVVQASVFLQTGTYFRRKTELMKASSPEEQMIIATFLKFKNGKEVFFEKESELLLSWCQKKILETK